MTLIEGIRLYALYHATNKYRSHMIADSWLPALLILSPSYLLNLVLRNTSWDSESVRIAVRLNSKSKMIVSQFSAVRISGYSSTVPVCLKMNQLMQAESSTRLVTDSAYIPIQLRKFIRPAHSQLTGDRDVPQYTLSRSSRNH